MFKCNLQKVHWWFERGFQISFFLLGFLSFIAYTFGTKIMSVLVVTTTVCAGFCLLYRLINYKHFIKNICFWLSVAFVLSYIISLLLNLKYGFLTPIKTLAWLGMQLVLLFTTDSRKSTSDFKREFHIIVYLFLILTAFAAILSLYQLGIGYSHSWAVDLGGHYRVMRAGFFWGRLWGVYSDPNYGSVMSMVSILFSVYFLRTVKPKLPKVLLLLNIPLQFLYIVFSDSRTGLVCACVSLAIYVYLILVNRSMKIALLPKNILCITVSIVMVFALVFASNVSRNGYNSLRIWMSEQNIGSSTDDTENPDDLTDDETDSESSNSESHESDILDLPATIGREEVDMNNDISNRRFDLWFSAIETVKLKPIFGFSFNNIVPAVTELLPDTYLINNDHGKFDNYHNVFFNILVGQGLVGAAIFLALAISAFVKSIQKLRISAKRGKDYEFYALAFSIIFMLLLSAAFVSDIIYAVSANAFLFWTLAGFLITNQENKKEE